MTTLYRFRWFRRWQGGVWYFVRPILKNEDTAGYWVHRQPYRTEQRLRKEVYG